MPRVQSWINATYAGTGICVSEYNVPSDGGKNGQTADPSTGAQEADILGMYGRLGYRLASYWTTPRLRDDASARLHNAEMALYRNYDGMGGKFGAYSIGAASTLAGLNVYAASDSRRRTPTTVWIMLVNVSTTAQSGVAISVQSFTPTGSAKVYRMSAGAAPSADTALAVSNGTLSGVSVPTNSAMLLVLSR